MQWTLVDYLFLVPGLIAHRALSTTPTRPPGFPPDREGNITCVGDKYDLDLPVIDGFNLNDLTMQQLCSLPQYGGKPDQHVGGWCDASKRHYSQWHLSFDISPASGANRILANPRVMLACSYRCWCNFPNYNEQPRGHPDLIKTIDSQTHKVTIDVVTDFNEPWQGQLEPFVIANVFAEVNVYCSRPPNQIGSSGQLVNSTRLYFRPYPLTGSARSPRPGNIPAIDVAMSVENQIECVDDLPRFPFPGGYDPSSFDSLQSLCAVQSFGGKGYANAGGYCHRSEDVDGAVIRRVWFSDEFTPRYDWTWNGGNFLGSAAIRYHCWQRCACAKDPTDRDRTSAFINQEMRLSSRTWIEQNSNDGSMTLNWDADRTDPAWPLQTMVILPAQDVARNRLNPHGPPAGTCGPDKRQFCPMEWPKAIGPVPQAPVGATLIVKSPAAAAAAVPSNNFTQCGQYCHGPQDCGSSNPDDQCFCAVPSPQDARTLGLDVVAPVPVCLVMAGLAVGSLAGRNEMKYLDERGMNYQCPCNATYTAPACCGSSDGMVWLDERKL